MRFAKTTRERGLAGAADGAVAAALLMSQAWHDRGRVVAVASLPHIGHPGKVMNMTTQNPTAQTPSDSTSPSIRTLPRGPRGNKQPGNRGFEGLITRYLVRQARKPRKPGARNGASVLA